MKAENKNYWLYVLRLEQEKFYVGVTAQTPEKRFKQHQNGFLAANWTKRYKPIEIFDKKDLGRITYEEAELFEGKVTRKYMDEYGLNNVRGGDLAEKSDYKQVFGRIFIKDDWQSILTVLFLLFIAVYFAFIYFLEKYS